MIIRMPTTSRPQQRYDHRLRDLVQRTGDLTIATDLGVPRSTARGWLGAPTVVSGGAVLIVTMFCNALLITHGNSRCRKMNTRKSIGEGLRAR
jgi:hypothetical protein